jgi:hypothetical protein
MIEKHGLKPGQVDDVSTLINYARKYGVVTKDGSSWNMSFSERKGKFKALREVIDAVSKNFVLKMRVQQEVIEVAKKLMIEGTGNAETILCDMPED